MSILNKLIKEGSVFDHPAHKILTDLGFKHGGTSDYDNETVSDYNKGSGGFGLVVQHQTKHRKTQSGKDYTTHEFHVFKNGKHSSTVHDLDHLPSIIKTITDHRVGK